MKDGGNSSSILKPRLFLLSSRASLTPRRLLLRLGRACRRWNRWRSFQLSLLGRLNFRSVPVGYYGFAAVDCAKSLEGFVRDVLRDEPDMAVGEDYIGAAFAVGLCR